MKRLVFYKCEICGNVAIKLIDSKVPVYCCGKIMSELIPNSVDASGEKHKPITTLEGNQIKVAVGEILHPMTAEHYISHIILETDSGIYIKNLSPSDQPTATYILADNEKPTAVYSICNLHGVWAGEIYSM